jgi:hypothetical protein
MPKPGATEALIKKDGPAWRAIHLVASLRSLAVMRMMMGVVVMGRTHRLCAWNREGDSGYGGQSKSKFSHEHYSYARFLSVQNVAKASVHVNQIFMNECSEGGISRSATRARKTNCCGAVVASSHRDRAYRAGTSPNWVKVKNPKHPAMTRVMEAFR